MDTAVALVQAYLNVNGYFTVVEYPVLEASRDGHARSVTDLDILALRFAGAGHDVIRGRRHEHVSGRTFETDRELGCPSDRPDMIVGEVKEGAARFNPATRDPAVLSVALARFGCCPLEQAQEVAGRLLTAGRAETPGGHLVRMVAFGGTPEANYRGHWTTVSMRHVIEFLRGYLHEHWEVLRHAQIKESVLGVLTLLEKYGVDTERTDQAAGERP